MNSNNRLSRNIGWPLVCLFFASVCVLNAASLKHVENRFVVDVGSNDIHVASEFYVSVVDGRAGYRSSDGSVQGVLGDRTVEDYVFFNAPQKATDLNAYAKGPGGIIKSYWVDGGKSALSYSNSVIALWDKTDPGASYAKPADYTKDTMARAGNTHGTMNLAGIDSGTVYFFMGTITDDHEITLTMSIGGKRKVMASSGYFRGNQNSFFVVSFDFETDGEYDTLEWEYVNDDADGSRARFGGVAIHAVAISERAEIPEPSSYALIAGCLAVGLVAMRRRR